MSQTDAHFVLPAPKLSPECRVLIVRAPYYKDVGDALLAGATAAIQAAGAQHTHIDVPGALEIPSAIAIAANSARFHAYVALGCVIRGETSHYDTVCNDSSRGLTLLGLKGHCIGNGILTVENHAQAAVRADPDGQNKGGGAAEAAMHLLVLKREMSQPQTPRSFRPDSEHIQIADKD